MEVRTTVGSLKTRFASRHASGPDIQPPPRTARSSRPSLHVRASAHHSLTPPARSRTPYGLQSCSKLVTGSGVGRGKTDPPALQSALSNSWPQG